MIPIDFGHKAIETGLIGGVGHFVGHPVDGLVVGNHQAGEVVGKVLALGCVIE